MPHRPRGRATIACRHRIHAAQSHDDAVSPARGDGPLGLRGEHFSLAALRELPCGAPAMMASRSHIPTRAISAAPAMTMRRCRSIVSSAMPRAPLRPARRRRPTAPSNDAGRGLGRARRLSADEVAMTRLIDLIAARRGRSPRLSEEGGGFRRDGPGAGRDALCVRRAQAPAPNREVPASTTKFAGGS